MPDNPHKLGYPVTADQNPDGTWNVRGVPVLPEHQVLVRRPDAEPKAFAVDSKWMKGALDRNRYRRKHDKYQGPIHIGHHGKDTPALYAGRFQLTKLAKHQYQGERKLYAFADYLGVPQSTFERMDSGELAYCSAEILSFSRGEIDSVALLSDEVPHFRTAIRIDKKTPHPAAGRGAQATYQAVGVEGDAIVYECTCEDDEAMTDEDKDKADDSLDLSADDDLDLGEPDESTTDPHEQADDALDLMADEPEDEDDDDLAQYSAAQLRSKIRSDRKAQRKRDRQRWINDSARKVVGQLVDAGYQASEVKDDALFFAAQGKDSLVRWGKGQLRAAKRAGRKPKRREPRQSFDDFGGSAAGLPDVPDYLTRYSAEVQAAGLQYAAQADKNQSQGLLQAGTDQAADAKRRYVLGGLLSDGLIKRSELEG